MRKNYWRNGFTTGLAVGSLVLLPIIVLLYRTYPVNCIAEASSHDGCTKIDSQQDQHWWLIRGVAYMDDTVAQWIMMIFTVIAVVLVYRTLISTQDMARETTRIGEAQVSAHVMPVSLTVEPRSIVSDGLRHQYFAATFKVKNVGATPAYRVCVAGISDNFGHKNWNKVKPSDIGPGEASDIRFQIFIDPALDGKFDHRHEIKIYVQFDTIFTRGQHGTKRIRFDYVTDMQGFYEAERL